jgi:hypothetical protein
MKAKTFEDFKKSDCLNGLLQDSINVSMTDGLTYTDHTPTRSIS